MMLDNKRGLSMVFVIAGIVIIIVAGLVVFFTSEDVQIGRRITTTQVESVREYIESCVKDRLSIKLDELRIQGGMNNLDNVKEDFGSFQFNVLYGPDITNSVSSVEDVQRFISEDIENFLKNNCDLQIFKENFAINDEEAKLNINVRTIIGEEIVTVNVVYPLIVSREDLSTKINEISVSVDDDFGSMRNHAEFIVTRFSDGLLEIDDIPVVCAESPFNDDGIDCDTFPIGNGKVIFIGKGEDFPENGESVNKVFTFIIK